ncbi:arylsulfotransferase family protein [Bacteroidota bacterium]
MVLLSLFISYYQNISGKSINNKKLQNQENIFDFPDIYSIEINNPSKGYYFFVKNYSDHSFIIISNNEGEIIFSRRYNENMHNFSLQPNGYLSYYSLNNTCFFVMDNSYNIIDKYSMKNNYTTDFHEFILLNNEHSFMMAYDPQTIDMSQIIEGGKADATVVGLVIQELDENKNVVFEWKSWDHFMITDSDTSTINLRSQFIDYVHGNSLCIESDTSLLLSSRNLNEITKINRITGDIIWRLGGYNNQFNFINDSGFARQHSISRLENGNILLFDNGTSDRNYSRGVEYQIDEESMTITMVLEFRHIPDIMTPLMGSIQRLENGNTLIGWGKNIGDNILTEFDKDGNIVNDLVSEDNIKSYRVSKHNWNANIFNYSIDTLHFDTVELHHEKIQNYTITNTLNDTIIFYGYNRGSHPFYITNPFPIILEGKKSIEIKVKFIPRELDQFNNSIVMYSNNISRNNEPQRVTASMVGKGISKEIISDINNQGTSENDLIKIYPNPAHNYLKINCKHKLNQIEIINLTGKQLLEIYPGNYDKKYEINISDLSPGNYILKLKSEEKDFIYKFSKINP